MIPLVVAPQMAKPPASAQKVLVLAASRKARIALRAAPAGSGGGGTSVSNGAPYARTPRSAG